MKRFFKEIQSAARESWEAGKRKAQTNQEQKNKEEWLRTIREDLIYTINNPPDIDKSAPVLSELDELIASRRVLRIFSALPNSIVCLHLGNYAYYRSQQYTYGAAKPWTAEDINAHLKYRYGDLWQDV